MNDPQNKVRQNCTKENPVFQVMAQSTSSLPSMWIKAQRPVVRISTSE
jgi:hypothetical protein